jgi:hypothetical protein
MNWWWFYVHHMAGLVDVGLNFEDHPTRNFSTNTSAKRVFILSDILTWSGYSGPYDLAGLEIQLFDKPLMLINEYPEGLGELPVRFKFLSLLQLSFGAFNHANVVIIDIEVDPLKKEVSFTFERFEPHGGGQNPNATSSLNYGLSMLNTHIGTLKFGWIVSKKSEFKLKELAIACPGPQLKYKCESILGRNDFNRGFCQAWSMFFLYMRLNVSAEMSDEDLVKALVSSNNEDKVCTRFARFMSHLVYLYQTSGSLNAKTGIDVPWPDDDKLSPSPLIQKPIKPKVSKKKPVSKKKTSKKPSNSKVKPVKKSSKKKTASKPKKKVSKKKPTSKKKPSTKPKKKVSKPKKKTSKKKPVSKKKPSKPKKKVSKKKPIKKSSKKK